MSERKEEWPAIGIDLGTKYACAAVWKDGCIQIIMNYQDNRKTPSTVAFTDAVRLIGEAAVNQGRLNPNNTIFDAKRLIGRRFNDELVKEDRRLWPFMVNSGEDEKPLVVVTYKGEEKHFCAEEISAMVLMKMKEIAEAFLGIPVKNAVVTVPAYFNDSQRQATKDAGAIAGFSRLHIINESSAAAIAYGFDKNMQDNDSFKKNVLIFDLGGGTFDVSLISIENDIFTVKAVGGNTHLGGSDFDNNMVNYFVEVFKKKHNKDASQSAKALARLRAACETAKKALSLITETSIEVDCLFDGIDFTSSISRAQFESLNSNLFGECIQIVDECLKDAGMGKSDVDDILLVGGSTRIPKVQQLLQEFFDGKELSRTINPDEAVAYGAAVHAGILCGVINDKNIKVKNCIPLSLGVKMKDGSTSVIVPKNTTIPTKNVRTYLAVDLGKNINGGIEIPWYEGDNFLGVIELSPISSTSQINVFCEININGIINVCAEDTSAGYKTETKIINRSRFTTKTVGIKMNEAEEYKAQDRKYEEMVKAKNKLENYANDVSEMIDNCEQHVRDEDKKLILEAVEQIHDWLDQKSGQVFETARYEEELEALQQKCKLLDQLKGQEERIELGKSNIHEKVENDSGIMTKEVEAIRKEHKVKTANVDKLGREQAASSSNAVRISDEEDPGDIQFVQYDFATLKIATSYFSVENKLGKKGSGRVYKGTLSNGKILAIKRFAGEKGAKEFMTEARLLDRLHHRNIVKLGGYCSEGEAKLLVYEFMPNSSLDNILFDPRKRPQLHWKMRCKIIIEIARGLEYLHEDSGLTVIHRDLNSANVLLDTEMNAKIAGFRVAKLLDGGHKLANTANIVGTRKYMAPEYKNAGEYSNKTDVYSFGIMLLEIVSGRRNQSPPKDDLLVKTWRLWKQGRQHKEIAEAMLLNPCSTNEVIRCIEIGLLCVQLNPVERPTMSQVVSMLMSRFVLPVPSDPTTSSNNRFNMPTRVANKFKGLLKD